MPTRLAFSGRTKNLRAETRLGRKGASDAENFSRVTIFGAALKEDDYLFLARFARHFTRCVGRSAGRWRNPT
jgi:hypothetical protein